MIKKAAPPNPAAEEETTHLVVGDNLITLPAGQKLDPAENAADRAKN
jgi:hypothetical protein